MLVDPLLQLFFLAGKFHANPFKRCPRKREPRTSSQKEFDWPPSFCKFFFNVALIQGSPKARAGFCGRVLCGDSELYRIRFVALLTSLILLYTSLRCGDPIDAALKKEESSEECSVDSEASRTSNDAPAAASAQMLDMHNRMLVLEGLARNVSIENREVCHVCQQCEPCSFKGDFLQSRQRLRSFHHIQLKWSCCRRHHL
jgi:hypothetical protein